MIVEGEREMLKCFYDRQTSRREELASPENSSPGP